MASTTPPPAIVALTNGAFTGLSKDESLEWIVARADGVQLVAYTAEELDDDVDGWVRRCREADLSIVAVHAPPHDIGRPSAAVVDRLVRVADGHRVVAHPDAMGDLAPWTRLGGQLLVETLDPGKSTGRTVPEVEAILGHLPDAGVCLDVSHSLTAGGPDLPVEMARRWGDRIGLLHVGCQRGRGAGRGDEVPAVDLDVLAAVRGLLPDTPVAVEGHWSVAAHMRVLEHLTGRGR
ncbi:sugar phosphate isomerase/epimerase family protein [Euzebya pacifica]|nr:TIM barrel protein [Euzebya pacifica]